jgi:hypothetical protein
VTRFNALRHGVLSRYTLLPWEDPDEYRRLLDALVAEHKPEGPTEEHLVEELAGILWRKRRLRLAEGAAYRRGLKSSASPSRETVMAALAQLGATRQIEGVVDAISATPDNTAEELAVLDQDEATTTRALELLRAGKARAYDKALDALREDTRKWWKNMLQPKLSNFDFGEPEERYTADADGLFKFLEEEVMPWYETRRKELQNRPLIRDQAFGEALDPDRLEGLARYEVHLDRKLERMLTMLIRLQDLRRAAVVAESTA